MSGRDRRPLRPPGRTRKPPTGPAGLDALGKALTSEQPAAQPSPARPDPTPHRAPSIAQRGAITARRLRHVSRWRELDPMSVAVGVGAVFAVAVTGTWAATTAIRGPQATAVAALAAPTPSADAQVGGGSLFASSPGPLPTSTALGVAPSPAFAAGSATASATATATARSPRHHAKHHSASPSPSSTASGATG